MRCAFLFVLTLIPASVFAQSNGPQEALLAKTRALYDTPFQRGLINFECAVDFDIRQHFTDNYGSTAADSNPIVAVLSAVHYRMFVDHSKATLSAQPKLPDLSGTPHAAEVEESNCQLMQVGINNWIPHAYGEILPIAPTAYNFKKTSNGYRLSMHGEGLDGVLTLDGDLHLTSGLVEKPMHIDMTMDYINGPGGLVLAASSVNTNHLGVVKFAYTYQPVDGFQIPATITLVSPQALTLRYSLNDCKTQHGIVVNVEPPSGN